MTMKYRRLGCRLGLFFHLWFFVLVPPEQFVPSVLLKWFCLEIIHITFVAEAKCNSQLVVRQLRSSCAFPQIILSNWHAFVTCPIKGIKADLHIATKLIVMDFASVASALLFLFVFLFDNSTSCRMQKTMHWHQQQENVETLLVMSIPSPGYWPQEWDNERVGRRNRRRTGWERRWGDGQNCLFWATPVSVLFDQDEVKC